MAQKDLEARFKKLKSKKPSSKKLKDYDTRMFRLTYMLNKLDRGGRISTLELAEQFNVSPRTVQRDIELLGMVDFPVFSPEKGQHSFMKGFTLKKMMLTQEEGSLLAFMAEIAKSLGGKFEHSFHELLKKVISGGSEPLYYAKIPEGIKLVEYPFLKDLEGAIEDCKAVELTYLKPEEEKQLKVDPLKIAFFDGFWYLICRICGKDWIVKLRLEKIKDLSVTKGRFEIPGNLKTMLEQSVNVWFPEERNTKVLLRVDKEVAQFFRQKKYFPVQKIKKENKDGSLVIETKVSQFEEITPTILHWIPHILIVKPDGLKKDIRNKVEVFENKL